MISLRGLFQSSIIYGIGSAVMRIMTFLLLPLYTNSQNSEGEWWYANYAIVITTIAFLRICYSHGTGDSFLKLYSQANGNNKKNIISTYIIYILMVAIIASGLLLLLNFLIGPQQTSSLLKLNDEIIDSFGDYTDPKGILHKKSDFDLHDTISVDTIRLDTYIEDKKINDIHYLKIDAEGNDLNVFKSLGIYKSIVRGCELEVWNEENTLFNDANWLDEVLNYMSLENFELVDRFVHGKGFSSDLLFINRNFIK